jgi:dsRNA-specific ribonuclease
MSNHEEIKELLNDGDIEKSMDNDELIFNPYNELNVEITSEDIFNILMKYGINTKYNKIDNIELYKRAFIHKSYTKRPQIENIENKITIVDKPDNCMPLKSKSNERLEFLGDGVLELVTKYCLYERFPKANEGFMTEKKIALVKNEAIGKIALEMGLNKYYIMSKHAEEKKSRGNLKKLGCLFEAFLGALFLDYNKQTVYDDDNLFKDFFVKTGPGFQMAQIFVHNVYSQHVDWTALILNDDNYKNILQVKVQKEFKTTPVYLEIDRTMDEGYTMGVYLILGYQLHEIDKDQIKDLKENGGWENVINVYKDEEKIMVLLGKARHKIKKKAEQVACQEAIEEINRM